ncbi:MAG: hypothetical protein HDR33_12195 [Treponema sp.]|nr:hypothetical protein [Treponema sp.]
MQKDVKSVVQKALLTILFSFVLFFSFDVAFTLYLGVSFAVFLLFNVSFCVRKNIKFYILYTICTFSNLGVFLFKKFQEGYWICWDKEDFFFIIYAFLLLAIFLTVLVKKVSMKKGDTVIENYFSERKYDLERLGEYINKFPMVGLNSIWGDGKTYLYKLFKEKYDKEYYHASICVMTLTIDSIEQFIANEINYILEKNMIFSRASKKFNSLLQNDIFYGFGNLFSKNSSYTEIFRELIQDVEKLERPILITFEDIDRIQEKETIYKIFAISELLTSESKRMKILFQYDEDRLLGILEGEKKYIEKYVPYKVELTPISFGRALKVLLSNGKKQNRYSNISKEDLAFLTQDIISDHHIDKAFGTNWSFSIHAYFSIRTITLFLDELEKLLEKNPAYSENKRIVISFLYIKHFLPDYYDEISFETRFIDSYNIEYNEKKYNIFEFMDFCADEKNNIDVESLQKIFAPNSKNLNHLTLLHLFEYDFGTERKIKENENPENRMTRLFNEDAESIRKKEHNDKIDRLIWNLFANGKSELTNLENAVLEMEKVLDKQGTEREEAYRNFLHSSYYEDFEKADNGTVFRFGVSSFFPLFQGFRIYERKADYWIKLLDLCFEKEKFKYITPEVIHILNYCDISQRKVFLHTLKKFNSLGIKGNLNNTECYPKFIKSYFGAFGSLRYIDTRAIRLYRFDNTNFRQYVNCLISEFTSELEDLKASVPIEEAKKEISLMIEFVAKNKELIQCEESLKEFTSKIKIETTSKDSLEDAFNELDKKQLSKTEMRKYLSENYKNEKLSAFDVKRIWEKYFPKNE